MTHRETSQLLSVFNDFPVQVTGHTIVISRSRTNLMKSAKMQPAAASLSVFLAVISVTLPGALAGYVPDRCMDCMCRVLTPGCRMPSPPCVLQGPGFLVCGPYRISRAYWTDARGMGEDLMDDWQSCAVSWTCSRRAVDGYMRRHAVKHRRGAPVLGHDPTCQDFARIHLGGPNGYLSDTTLHYWESVARCLQGDPQYLQPNAMGEEYRRLQWEL
ncbi:PREDICTED: lysozyme-like [Branchiostoma belcheri]|uniref:lysozyme n=1 Tax=Branchiostoma belcheri TaxID=7741 RepID=A0A6P5AA73_BRABE|nr:PREDICTED: lysozyme-like [Branchiostoma belcheri]